LPLELADLWLADLWLADRWLADLWLADRWLADRWLADRWLADRWLADLWLADLCMASLCSALLALAVRPAATRVAASRSDSSVEPFPEMPSALRNWFFSATVSFWPLTAASKSIVRCFRYAESSDALRINPSKLLIVRFTSLEGIQSPWIGNPVATE
jgi:hypothetical protein